MSKKRLSDVVNGALEDMLAAGERRDPRSVAVEVWDDVDDDGQYMAGIEGLTARINKRSAQLKLVAEKAAAERQAPLPFDLPAMVSMDIDGHLLVPTRNLSRTEFARAISIREEQIANDRKSVKRWRDALKTADRIWKKHPEWTFGRCIDAILGVPEAAA